MARLSPLPIHRSWSRRSLQLRLLLPVGVLAILGLGSVTAWSALQMQRLLIGSHKQTLDYIAQQFPARLAAAWDKGEVAGGPPGEPAGLGSANRPLSQVLQQTLDQLATDDAMLWVRDANGRVLAESGQAATDAMSAEMLAPYLSKISRTQLLQLGDRYLLACSQPLSLPAEPERGQATQRLKLYIAHDVTTERQQILTGLRNLILVDLLITLLLLGALAFSIRHALSPLARMNHLARELSVSNLDHARLSAAQSPDEIRDLVEGFNAMLDRLAEAWQKQRQFVNDASHELRTPLSIVDGYLQSLLRRRQSLTPHQLEALTAAEEETQRTIQMLKEMLAIARSDNGQLQFNLGPVPLADLLKAIAKQAESTYARSVLLELPSQPLMAWADPNHLQQALMNLVENAVKYSAAPSPVRLCLDQRGNQLAIAVIDQGIGILPEQQDAVFERFYRADEARNRKGGTGLGLALTKTLIEGMGGTIELRSRPQEGTVFTLLLLQAHSPTHSPATGEAIDEAIDS